MRLLTMMMPRPNEHGSNTSNNLLKHWQQVAVALFMELVGTPADQIEAMRHAPAWPMFEALAQTLAYDHSAILGADASVPTERAAHVTAPALLMHGGASFPFMS